PEQCGVEELCVALEVVDGRDQLEPGARDRRVVGRWPAGTGRHRRDTRREPVESLGPPIAAREQPGNAYMKGVRELVAPDRACLEGGQQLVVGSPRFHPFRIIRYG